MKTLPCFSTSAPKCTGSLFAERQGVCPATLGGNPVTLGLAVGNQETTWQM
jgi:hypothetical protein